MLVCSCEHIFLYVVIFGCPLDGCQHPVHKQVTLWTLIINKLSMFISHRVNKRSHLKRKVLAWRTNSTKQYLQRVSGEMSVIKSTLTCPCCECFSSFKSKAKLVQTDPGPMKLILIFLSEQISIFSKMWEFFYTCSLYRTHRQRAKQGPFVSFVCSVYLCNSLLETWLLFL